jgi:hypothetical protein
MPAAALIDFGARPIFAPNHFRTHRLSHPSWIQERSGECKEERWPLLADGRNQTSGGRKSAGRKKIAPLARRDAASIPVPVVSYCTVTLM